MHRIRRLKLILRAPLLGLSSVPAAGQDAVMIPSHKRAETSERPITFNAAENLGAFRLAEL